MADSKEKLPGDHEDSKEKAHSNGVSAKTENPNQPAEENPKQTRPPPAQESQQEVESDLEPTGLHVEGITWEESETDPLLDLISNQILNLEDLNQKDSSEQSNTELEEIQRQIALPGVDPATQAIFDQKLILA